MWRRAFSGAGDTKWSFFANLLSMWGVRLPIALLLIGSLGLTGMWIAMCSELILKGLFFLWRLRSNRWLDSGMLVSGASDGQKEKPGAKRARPKKQDR